MTIMTKAYCNTLHNRIFQLKPVYGQVTQYVWARENKDLEMVPNLSDLRQWTSSMILIITLCLTLLCITPYKQYWCTLTKKPIKSKTGHNNFE